MYFSCLSKIEDVVLNYKQSYKTIKKCAFRIIQKVVKGWYCSAQRPSNQWTPTRRFSLLCYIGLSGSGTLNCNSIILEGEVNMKVYSTSKN